MSDTPWTRDRDEWVKTLTVDEGKHLSSVITRDRKLDENEGDSLERKDALRWLRSRGARGDEWGIVGAAAKRLGLYPRQGVEPALHGENGPDSRDAT